MGKTQRSVLPSRQTESARLWRRPPRFPPDNRNGLSERIGWAALASARLVVFMSLRQKVSELSYDLFGARGAGRGARGAGLA